MNLNPIEVPLGNNATDTAVLLLAAAQELGLPPAVITTTSGAFQVPQEVHDRAFGPRADTPAPAKKVAAKSPTPKKAQE